MLRTPELQTSENGFLSWKYYGQRLYAVDDETGDRLAGPICSLWLKSGSTYYTIVQPETVAFEPTSTVGNVQCQYVQNEKTAGWNSCRHWFSTKFWAFILPDNPFA